MFMPQCFAGFCSDNWRIKENNPVAILNYDVLCFDSLCFQLVIFRYLATAQLTQIKAIYATHFDIDWRNLTYLQQHNRAMI